MTASPKIDLMFANNLVGEKNIHTPPASPLAPLLADAESHLAIDLSINHDNVFSFHAL